MSQKPLLTDDALKQIATSIVVVATGIPSIYQKNDIAYCQDIVRKINSGNAADFKIATGKISSKLNKTQIKHSETDLAKIAELIKDQQVSFNNSSRPS